MEARLARAALMAASILSLGAGYRTQNFIVTAATPQLSREIAEAAERYRRDLALEWLGHELEPWQDICPIEAQVGRMGAGGATSFMFQRGRPFGWTMTIQGSRQRILDSVLPHEITHTIFATHFGRPLPRWADEGACTTVEHESERAKQKTWLIKFLKTDRGIAFNRMFAMKEYPRDVLPLYSQGYSVARFLIAQGGKRKFIDYLGDGMKWNNWTKATRVHYQMESLSELQVTWLDWVRRGSPPLTPATTAIARQEPPTEQASSNLSRAPQADEATGVAGSPPFTHVASSTGGQPARSASASGWYSRVRDETQRRRSSSPDEQSIGGGSVSRPQPPGRPQQVILEWEKDAASPPGRIRGRRRAIASATGTSGSRIVRRERFTAQGSVEK